METTLAILMVLGIFVGVPALIGFAIAAIYILKDHRVRRAERAKALGEVTAEAASAQTAGVHGEGVAKEATKEHAPVA